MTQEQTPAGPDLTKGVTLGDFADGKLLGHVGESAVLLVQANDKFFAVDAQCTHYQGPLAEGLVVGETIRCPWHHACFDLTTGEAVRAPALSSLSCWTVEQKDGRVFVSTKQAVANQESGKRTAKAKPDAPQKIVIVGGGAAGFAAAEMLRREEFSGDITMLSNDAAAPVDRPNLSKDYLAGSAPEDWLPLRPDEFYREAKIDLRLKADVVSIDRNARQIATAAGAKIPYDRLLLATGAEPVRLSIPGAAQPNVHTLRTLADCRAIIDAAKSAKRAIVVGASFIGLEVAASLRAGNIEVHVVAPEKIPMERVLGPQLGSFVKSLHEEHGVIFHLEETLTAISGRQATLKSGAVLEADFFVVGIGVRPRLTLAEQAGLELDRGVLVNAFLQTSDPNIYAAGDIARWPDAISTEKIRVEHWVVAERQGQAAARNMLGQQKPFDSAPFFWSQHYDVPINYVGHAEQWDKIAVDGDIAAKDCMVTFQRNGRVLAAASIYRDLASLKAEIDMERATGPS